ncbi:MAG: hypothetical protein QM752_03650 [Gammaproteobacteria bacterium]
MQSSRIIQCYQKHPRLFFGLSAALVGIPMCPPALLFDPKAFAIALMISSVGIGCIAPRLVRITSNRIIKFFLIAEVTALVAVQIFMATSTHTHSGNLAIVWENARTGLILWFVLNSFWLLYLVGLAALFDWFIETQIPTTHDSNLNP